MTKLNGKFQILDWQEASYFDVPAPAKANRAEIKLRFEGDMAGEADLVYLMSYVSDSLAYYCGFLYFTGEIAGQKGSFTIIDTGIFNEKGAASRWEIAVESGSGALTGIRGNGGYAAAEGRLGDFELDYQLPSA